MERYVKSMKPDLQNLLACIVLPSFTVFAQGNLTPPGAPAPTMKTLDQVEARKPIGPSTSSVTISAPDSYYLAGDITISAAAANGLSITSGEVTLDLNGFTIRKAAGVTGGGGVSISGPVDNSAHNITIRNGHVSGEFDYGVVLTRAHNVAIEGLAIQGSLSSGVYAFSLSLSPNSVVVRRCRILGEPVDRAANPPVTAMMIAAINFSFCTPILIEDCLVANVAGDGIRLLTANFSDTTTSGIVRGCVVSRCGGIGIDMHVNSAVPRGVLVEKCTIDQCGGDGVNIASAARVVDCVSKSNTGDGFQFFQEALISGCVADTNGGDGIQLGNNCQAINNIAKSNGTVDGAGIHVTSGTCVVEDNTVTLNDRGIDVDGTLNLIIKNRASFNTTNYDIAASNKVGVIVSAPASAAISGSTGGAGVGSTDPWANISY
jgi:parallel beta-helix repeat protein